MLQTVEKKAIVEKHKRHETDTGSSEVQVALLTKNIITLTEHFKVNPKDHGGRRGLFRMVDTRRKLLKYLKSRSFQRYNALIASLGLRK